MPQPFVIIVNGPPGVGKTTLAGRLARDLQLPVLSRDGIAETLYDALDYQTTGRPALFGHASFTLLYYFAGTLLAAGQSVIVEGCFRFPEVATNEFRQLQQQHDFIPLQIQCQGDGSVILERFLARASTPERHVCHRDLEFAEHSRDIFLRGRLADLSLGGQVVDIDMTDLLTYNYVGLLDRVRSILHT